MANPFLAPKRPRILPRLIAAAVVLLAVVAVGVAVESQLGPRAPKTYAPPAAIPLPGATSATPRTEPSQGGTPALSGALQLVQGAQLVNGLQIGYPHSTVGAVSAAAEYMRQIGSTLDPDRAAAVGRLAADSSWSDAPQQLAQGPVATRKVLGLPTTGQLTASASVVLSPVEYQVPSATADGAKVLLLATYTTSSPGQGIQTHMGVYPMDMHWSAGDWHVLAPTDDADYRDLAAQPDSPDASAKGWQELKH